MRGKDHEHKHAAHMGHHKHRAKGGKAVDGGGDPYVKHEAEEKEDGEETEAMKKGGRAKKHHGEHKKERKRGGKIEGHEPKHRMDRPGRKRGGRVGADTSPLSSFHHVAKGPSKEPATEEGGLSK
jgi:hypothetical protein